MYTYTYTLSKIIIYAKSAKITILMGIEIKHLPASCLVHTTVVNMSSCTQWTLHSAYKLVLATVTYPHN